MKRSLSSSILRKRNLGRLFLIASFVFVVKSVFFPRSHEQEIKHHNVLERVTHADKTLDAQRHDFLQRRMGGSLPKDILDDLIYDGERSKPPGDTNWPVDASQTAGVQDYWKRFQSKLHVSLIHAEREEVLD